MDAWLIYVIPGAISLTIGILSYWATRKGIDQQTIAKREELRLQAKRDELSSDLGMYDRVIVELREVKEELAAERNLRKVLEARVDVLEAENKQIRADNEQLRKCNDQVLIENKTLRLRVVELEKGTE